MSHFFTHVQVQNYLTKKDVASKPKTVGGAKLGI